MRAIVVGSLVLLASLLTCGPAHADVRVVVFPDASAPVAVAKCSSEGIRRFANISNRTNYLLRTFTLRWTAFDTNDKKLGGADVEYDIDGLGSGAADGYYEDVPKNAFTSGSASSISWYSCKVIAGTFDNGPRWSAGKTWPEPLLPINAAHEQDQNSSGPGGPPGSPSGGPAGGPAGTTRASRAPDSTEAHSLQFSIEKSWTDLYQGQYFIHDTLLIHGGASEVTIAANNFVLTVNLANGGIARYTGMMQAAPTYLKYNYLVAVYIPQYQVDPATDLGALGALIVPAGGTVKVIVTWVSSAPPKDSNSNSNVTIP
jgi:hypothetical protein